MEVSPRLPPEAWHNWSGRNLVPRQAVGRHRKLPRSPRPLLPRPPEAHKVTPTRHRNLRMPPAASSAAALVPWLLPESPLPVAAWGRTFRCVARPPPRGAPPPKVHNWHRRSMSAAAWAARRPLRRQGRAIRRRRYRRQPSQALQVPIPRLAARANCWQAPARRSRPRGRIPPVPGQPGLMPVTWAAVPRLAAKRPPNWPPRAELLTRLPRWA